MLVFKKMLLSPSFDWIILLNKFSFLKCPTDFSSDFLKRFITAQGLISMMTSH